MFLSSKDFKCFKRSGTYILKEWIQCLCSNVVNHLFVATSQSTTDPMVQTWRFNTSDLTLIQDQLCTKLADLYHIKGRFEGNIVRVLELNVWPEFVLIKQIILIVNSTQCTMSSNSSSIVKGF